MIFIKNTYIALLICLAGFSTSFIGFSKISAEALPKEEPEFTQEIHDRMATEEEIEAVNQQAKNKQEYANAMDIVYKQQVKNNYILTLTKSSGVYNYNSKKETYYGPNAAYDYLCEPDGNGVWRTKRNINYDLNTHSYFIDDINGVPTWLFVVASSEYSKQTIIEISYGLAIVLDCGCAVGTVDVFVGPNWY